MRLRVNREQVKQFMENDSTIFVKEPTLLKGQWQQFFKNDAPIYAEFGMGKGQFITQMSKRFPDINFIGIDMYDELIKKAADKAADVHMEQTGEQGYPANLALVRMNLETAETVFTEGELNRIYLNFSDPWPKKRHAARRLTHKNFLDKYKVLLHKEGEVHFKTDSRSLFEFSLNSLCENAWFMRNIALDLHAEHVREDLVLTEYEQKFHDKGMPIFRVETWPNRL